MDEGRERCGIYRSKVKVPPRGPAKFWKDQLRRFLIKAIQGALPNSQPVFKGISWHYSNPLERGIDMETDRSKTPEEVLKVVMEALWKVDKTGKSKG